MMINNKIIRKWYIFDAENQVLGRLATKIAFILQGKHKIEYESNIDIGDYVVVTNAPKIKLTGAKMEQKKYYKHSGYIGSLKEINVKEMLAKKPEMVIKKAVQGMVPRNKLKRARILRLKVYPTSVHPHQNVKFENLHI